MSEGWRFRRAWRRTGDRVRAGCGVGACGLRLPMGGGRLCPWQRHALGPLVLTQMEGQPPLSLLGFPLSTSLWGLDSGHLRCQTELIPAPENMQKLKRPLGIRVDDIFINTESLGWHEPQ